MLQPGGEHDLVLETLEVHAGREMGRKHFHDDPTTERALLRHEHATHATATELAFDAIRAGQRGLQPLSKIGLHVLNLLCPHRWGRTCRSIPFLLTHALAQPA